ncbi:MAG: murein biosynthesis integral membrane protein MurJ [Candidatus Promineifilaceae bacterium]|jgi:putative peptidoglycan lipid II flippase
MADSQVPADKTVGEDSRKDRALVMRAAGLVGALILLSRVVGLIREIVTRSLLGVTTVEATAYDIAKVFPESIFLIIAGGAIGSAFIPTFTAYLTDDDESGAWRLFSAVINLVTVAITIVAVLAMIFADQIVGFFYAPAIAEHPELLDMTVRLMRVMLVSPIIFGASGVVMGALNARQHFLTPALAPTIYNLGIIAGGLLFGQTVTGVAMGFAIGMVIGAFGHLLIQIPSLYKQGARYQPLLTVHDPGVIKVLKLMAPRVLGLSFSEINKFIMLFMTGSMALGSLPALNVAFRLIILPQGIIGQAMGIAAFPTLSSLAAREKFDEMRMIINDSLRMLLFLGLPMTAWLILLAEPVITILFERGLFDSEATRLVAGATQLMALGLLALLFLEVIARSFYALSDTLTPVLVGGIQVMMMAIFSVGLRDLVFASRDWPPLGALVLAFSLSNYVEVGVLVILLRRKLGYLNGAGFYSGAWRMLLGALLMAGAMWVTLGRINENATWLQLIFGVLVGGIVYFLSCLLLRVKELQRILAISLESVSRGR